MMKIAFFVVALAMVAMGNDEFITREEFQV